MSTNVKYKVRFTYVDGDGVEHETIACFSKKELVGVNKKVKTFKVGDYVQIDLCDADVSDKRLIKGYDCGIGIITKKLDITNDM